MPKQFHEVRDPIHVFVRMDSDEREVINSEAFQRLRFVHQLALTYLIYPGATHRRFEHSLGVMELATRVYDVVTSPHNLTDAVKNELPELSDDNKRTYWRRVLRMAALCHDVGHLPFSHAAEDLLPEGTKHEAISAAIIRSDKMKAVWENMTPPLRTEDVVKIALGPKEAKGLRFTTWESILAEIIVGDGFGADRMDYLLRDSYHAGVSYGRFDHYRLIDTMRILPPPPRDNKTDASAPELA
jgi:HD superfamily phosphohydrolase